MAARLSAACSAAVVEHSASTSAIVHGEKRSSLSVPRLPVGRRITFGERSRALSAGTYSTAATCTCLLKNKKGDRTVASSLASSSACRQLAFAGCSKGELTTRWMGMPKLPVVGKPGQICCSSVAGSECDTSAEAGGSGIQEKNTLEEEERGEKTESTKCVGRSIRDAALCFASAAAIALAAVPLSLSSPPPPALAASVEFAAPRGAAYAEIAGLIAGPPVKDPRALLRYALPINNKPIKEVQAALESITEDLKIPKLRALDNVERSVRKASRALSQNKAAILADVAPDNKAEGTQLLDKLEDGLQSFSTILADKDREAVAPKQRELLDYIGAIEEAMVEKFPYEVPAEYANKPVLKGRATVEMMVKIKDNPNLPKPIVLRIIVDGYNAPVTAGNFVDLVQRHFYDGMEIQRADGFVVQTGDPDGPSEGFIDPSTNELRTVPLEIKLNGDKEPIYGDTLEEIGRFRETTSLPFNAFGTMAMAREEFSNDSGSSQIFWLLKESELTPTGANILDGRYAVFGYVTENEEKLADMKVGDVVVSMRVTQGLDNLEIPSVESGKATAPIAASIS